ncbi:MAG: ACT domain-containing protein [Firmicutes bacterium]|nr:ACT domain-containing protein [Bacillota bacterium]
MKAVITVVGKDQVGILALIANECANAQINIADVSQTILDGIFTMTMVVEFSEASVALSEFSGYMRNLGESKGLVIRVMNQAIFDSMHRI